MRERAKKLMIHPKPLNIHISKFTNTITSHFALPRAKMCILALELQWLQMSAVHIQQSCQESHMQSAMKKIVVSVLLISD
jgi:hypothetical protein